MTSLANRSDAWLTEDGLLRIGGWARDGLTFAQIAQNMGISLITLHRWREKYPELEAVLTESRDVVDRHVENAMHRRAMGYEYTERKTLVREHPDGTQTREVTEFKKHMPPDTIAQIFWLKNRKPAYWRDRQDLNISGEIGLVTIVDDLPVGEIVDAVLE